MARGSNQKADFSLIIGLDTTALFAGMDQANTTISQAISRINSEAAQVRIRMNTESIRAGTDEFRKQEIEVQALNRQLELQRAKLALLGQARDSAYKTTGANSAASRAAQTSYLRQENAVAKLEAELKRLQAEMARTETRSSSMFGRIKSGAESARSSIGGITGAYTTLSTKLASLTALAVAGGGLFNITDSAMKAGESVYKLSQRLQMSTSDAAMFKRTFDVIGADVNTVIPFFARLDKQVANAGASGNTTTLALAKFGVTLTDSAGKILPLNDQLAELSKGYKNAVDSGKEMEFTAQVLGARGAALVPVLEQYQTAMEAASRVKTTGLLNPQEAHETYIEWLALKMEAGQLSNAFGAAMLPVARELMPDIEDGIGNLVSIIRDNKSEITSTVKEWASMFGEVAKGAAEAAKAVADVHGAFSNAKDVKDENGKTTRITDRDRLEYLYGKGAKESYEGIDVIGNILGGMGAIAGGITSRSTTGAAGGFAAGKAIASGGEWLGEKMLLIGEDTDKLDKQVAYQKQRKELADQEKKAFASLNEQIKKSTDANGENSKSTDANANAQAKAAAAVEKRKTAVGQLTEEIFKLTHSDYENSMHTLSNKVEELTAAGIPKADVDKYASAYQADLQRSMKTGLLNPIADAFKTDLQKSLDDIDNQAEEMRHKWRGSGHEGDIDAWAKQRKSQITSDWDKEVASQIDSIWKSSYDKRLDEIEREKQAWVKKGLDEVKATKWAEESKRQAMQETAQGMFTSNKKYYRAWKAAGGIGSGQAGIDAIANQMRREQGIPKSAFTTPGEIQAFESAMSSAKSNLVPIISDGTYQGTKAAMIEVLRGTSMTNESGQQQQYQPSFDVNAPSIDFTPLVSAIDTAAAQQRETMEIIRGTMTQTIDIASSSADAELSSYKLWTEQEAQQILQAADHTVVAFNSGEQAFNVFGEAIRANTSATESQTQAMMQSASGSGSVDTGRIDNVVNAATSVLNQMATSDERAAMKIVSALDRSSMMTRQQLQQLQSAQQKVRQAVYRTTNIYPREMTQEQIRTLANDVTGEVLGDVNELDRSW